MARQLSFPLRLIDLRPDAFATAEGSGIPDSDREPSHRRGRNIVLIGAVAGFFAGMLLWGSLAMSLFAVTDSLLGGEPHARPVGRTLEDGRFDCASFGVIRALSAEDEERFQAQCSAAPVNVTPADAPPAPGSGANVPGRGAGNRADCDQIRGTQYLSGEERTWFLANCVTP